MHGIRLDETQRGAEANRLADGHPRLYSHMTGERGDLPELARGVGSEQGRGKSAQPFVTCLFTAKREEGNPDAGGGQTRWMPSH